MILRHTKNRNDFSLCLRIKYRGFFDTQGNLILKKDHVSRKNFFTNKRIYKVRTFDFVERLQIKKNPRKLVNNE